MAGGDTEIADLLRASAGRGSKDDSRRADERLERSTSARRAGSEAKYGQDKDKDREKNRSRESDRKEKRSGSALNAMCEAASLNASADYSKQNEHKPIERSSSARHHRRKSAGMDDKEDKEQKYFEKDGYREREQDKERERDRDRDRDRERERDKNKDRDRERDKDKDRDRERDRDRDRGRERDRDKDRDKEKDRDRERDKTDRDRDRDERYKEKEKDKRDRIKADDGGRQSRKEGRSGTRLRAERGERGSFSTDASNGDSPTSKRCTPSIVTTPPMERLPGPDDSSAIDNARDKRKTTRNEEDISPHRNTRGSFNTSLSSSSVATKVNITATSASPSLRRARDDTDQQKDNGKGLSQSSDELSRTPNLGVNSSHRERAKSHGDTTQSSVTMGHDDRDKTAALSGSITPGRYPDKGQPTEASPSTKNQQANQREKEAIERRRKENQAARATRSLAAIDPHAALPPAIVVDLPAESEVMEHNMTEDDKLWKKQVMRTLRSRTISTILSGVQLRALGIGAPQSQPEDPDREAKALKRTLVVKEIVTTENNYKRDLNIIIDCWRARLQDSGLLSDADISRIFGNVDDLLVLSEEICKALEGIDLLPSEQQNVAERFIRFIDYLRLYIKYCANHNLALTKARELTQQNSKIENLMTEIQNLPECKNLDLKSYLIKPLQRVTKYPLLFKEIAKNTSEQHADFDQMRVCLEKLRGIMEEIDERTKQTESKFILLLLQERFVQSPEDPGFTLTSQSDRMFLMEERFEKMDVDKGPTYKPCQLLLFNDMLLFASPKKNRKNKSEGKYIKVLSMDLRQMFALEEDKGFQVVSTLNDKTKVTVITSLPEQKTRWVEKINAMAKALYKRDFGSDDDPSART